MNALWRCAVCETVNDGGRVCAACGAPLTRRSAAVTTVRGKVFPVQAPPAPAPLPEPVQRAINREPIDEDGWEPYEPDFSMVPIPGGCLFVSRPRRYY
jgi:hypothetical protein